MEPSFTREQDGAVLIEFSIIFPLLLALTIGIVDSGLVMFTIAEANRATQVGARCAVVKPPVAEGLGGKILPLDGAVAGTPCFNPEYGTTTNKCYVPPKYTCFMTSSGAGTCTSNEGSRVFDDEAFDDIFAAMKQQFGLKGLDKRQVVIEYTPLSLGYVGRAETSMNVTVSMRCLKQQLIILDALYGWVSADSPADCDEIAGAGGILLGSFSTTLLGEDFSKSSVNDDYRRACF